MAGSGRCGRQVAGSAGRACISLAAHPWRTTRACSLRAEGSVTRLSRARLGRGTSERAAILRKQRAAQRGGWRWWEGLKTLARRLHESFLQCQIDGMCRQGVQRILRLA